MTVDVVGVVTVVLAPAAILFGILAVMALVVLGLSEAAESA